MRNKILIVDADLKESQQLEQIFEEVVQKGGELLFARKREDGLTLVANERPQLVFLDADLIGENEDAWVAEGVHIVVMRGRREPRQKSEDFVLKPLKPHQVLEKALQVLVAEPAPPIPPM